ncbi:MAG: hypothetical protein LH468_11790 [Nocardioides sp.]|nr:hypothetical protein [Nocardioides sp.]
MADPRTGGALIGAVGASVFVHANRAHLSAAWSLGAVVVWAAALVAFAWAVYVMPRRFTRPRPVPRTAGLVYLGSVAGMIVLIQVGRIVLEARGAPAVIPGVIVLAVGLHFLPFARAFHTPMFRRLGLAMAILGVLAVVVGLIWTATATAAIAVLTGIVMLAVIIENALRDRPRRAPW